MGETQNLRNNRKEKYDPIYGRFVRDIKTTDIVNIFAKASPTSNDTLDWNMITYTTDANHAVFPYIFGAHACGICSCPQFFMFNGTTTIMAIQTDNTGEGQNIVTGCECPFTRIAPSSTLSIHMVNVGACTADTFCAFIVAKREPIVAVVEN